MNTKLQQYLQRAEQQVISAERAARLAELISYLKASSPNRLHFICTHNSRRSQLAQAWAKIAAHQFRVPLESFSGGVEVTACNPRTVAALQRVGVEIEATAEGDNPVYHLKLGEETLSLFSKLYDHPSNPRQHFAAVMTCSHADENCPFIPGTQTRIALNYDDPKAFDDTPQEQAAYDARCLQIAAEMMYVFKRLSND